MTDGNPSTEKGTQVGKIIASLVIAAAALLGSGGVADAAYCGASTNGCEQSSRTPCSGHGSFGAFGEQGDFGHDFRGGADGQLTGQNNSNLCGNPQGATAD
jgi:hypothetical protein